MKKVFIFFGVMCLTSFILTGCGGNKSSEDNESSIVKAKKTKQIMKEVIIDDNPNPIYWKTVINYNTNGKITEEIHFDRGDILHSREQYTYNEFGNKIEWSIFNSNKELREQTTYLYDNSRKLMKEITKLFDGSQSESTYSYDSQGKNCRIDSKNSFTYRVDLVYDKNNKLKSQICYNNDGSKDIQNFDKNGSPIVDKNNSFKYDEKNNIIEEFHSYPSGISKFTNEYKYNEQGEWIEKKTYFSTVKTELGKLRNTVTREITYYP